MRRSKSRWNGGSSENFSSLNTSAKLWNLSGTSSLKLLAFAWSAFSKANSWALFKVFRKSGEREALLDHRSVQISKYVDWGFSRGISAVGKGSEGCFKARSNFCDSGVDGMVMVWFSQSMVGLTAERKGSPRRRSSANVHHQEKPYGYL